MSLKLVITLFLFNSIVLFSQEKTKKHTIVKGETVSSIAEKYEVNPSEIYKLNPKAKNLLKLNSVLLIPTSAEKNTNAKTKIAANYSGKEHEVLVKETLYGIAKEYGITLKELNQANPTLETSGLKIGQKITIPGNAKSNTEIAVSPHSKKTSQNTQVEVTSENTNSSSEVTIIEVLPKESKYSIAKKYGISLKELDKVNPAIGVKSLRVGQKINIPTNASIVAEVAVVSEESKPVLEEATIANTQSKKDSSKEEEVIVPQSKKEKLTAEIVGEIQPSAILNSTTQEDIIREVLPKETKYGIAKEYGITVQELEKQNPEVKKSLPVGYKLNIHSSNVPKEEIAVVVNAEINKNEVSKNENSTAENNTIETTKSEIKSFVSMARNSDFLDQLIEKAAENIGTRYQTGGTSKSGFDCSGLMCNTFGAFDIKLPRSSIEQSGFGNKVEAEEAKKGDLIFFKTNGRNQINHVGMVVEVCDGEIKFIHASVGNGVIISSTKENYYKKKVVQVNRVL
ncbi:LysM peptidoglycan-binding domain-containing protein [Flavobacterium sp. LS2P90]|uniref:LysM peptidoglycan-binding domain-containing protein n=1 Tax=Flavobacterium xylosi TaxID=3230415 RepID=A0ABW6HZG1_9FLAO